MRTIDWYALGYVSYITTGKGKKEKYLIPLS